MRMENIHGPVLWLVLISLSIDRGWLEVTCRRSHIPSHPFVTLLSPSTLLITGTFIVYHVDWLVAQGTKHNPCMMAPKQRRHCHGESWDKWNGASDWLPPGASILSPPSPWKTLKSLSKTYPLPWIHQKVLRREILSYFHVLGNWSQWEWHWELVYIVVYTRKQHVSDTCFIRIHLLYIICEICTRDIR